MQSPTDEEVASALRSALADSLKCSPDDVEGYLKGGGEIDSYNGVEVLLAMGAAFGIDLADGEMTSWLCRSPARMAQLLRRRVREGDKGGAGHGR
jgi:hypothetical protein